jgi:hypothetical protein
MPNINNDTKKSEADYPNWNAEQIYLKYREKYNQIVSDGQKQSGKSFIETIIKIIEKFFECVLGKFPKCLLKILCKYIFGDSLCFIFISVSIYCLFTMNLKYETNRAILLFWFLLITRRLLRTHFKTFAPEKKRIANKALDNMFGQSDKVLTDRAISEIYAYSETLEDDSASWIKQVGQIIITFVTIVILPNIPSILNIGVKPSVEGEISVFTLVEIFQLFLLIIDIGLYLYNVFYWLFKSLNRDLDLYKEVLKEKKLTLVLKNEGINKL